MRTELPHRSSSSMIRMFSMAAVGPAVQPPNVEISRKYPILSVSSLNMENTRSVVTQQEIAA